MLRDKNKTVECQGVSPFRNMDCNFITTSDLFQPARRVRGWSIPLKGRRGSLIFLLMDKKRTRYRILIIDDDKVLSIMVGQMIRRMGYSTVVCNQPMDALALFSRVPDRFDAVITDEIMPDLRGTQLAAQFLRIKHDIPIILMTGRGDMISMEQIRKSGVRSTLIKPVIKEWLQDVLTRLLK
jgi:CheY-like chemotaxis protein